MTWLPCDLLDEDIRLPSGRVVLLLGGGDLPRWPWRAALDVAVPTARLLPALVGREVVLPLWSGDLPTPVTTPGGPELSDWCARLTVLAARPYSVPVP